MGTRNVDIRIFCEWCEGGVGMLWTKRRGDFERKSWVVHRSFTGWPRVMFWHILEDNPLCSKAQSEHVLAHSEA